MKLGPSLDESLLALGDEADDERDRRDGNDGDMLTVVGVKVRDVMARSVRGVGEGPCAETGIRNGPGRRTGSLTLRGESAPPNHPGLFNKGCLPAPRQSNLLG